MSEQPTTDHEFELTERRAAQAHLWRDGMCMLALAVRRMWMYIGESLHLTEDAVHAITNLARTSGDHTLSVSELAEASDLSLARAAATIDTLLERRLVVRALPRNGEPLHDRRVRVPNNLVGMIVEYYKLQPHHHELLDQFTAKEIDLLNRVLGVATSIADDKAQAIRSGQVNPAAQLQGLLGGIA